MSASLTGLPPELLTIICENVLQDGDEQDIRSVSSISRTCVTLRTINKPVLFRQLDGRWLRNSRSVDEQHDFIENLSHRVCRIMRFIVENSQVAELIRVADLHSLTWPLGAYGVWGYQPYTTSHYRTSEPMDQLLELMGVGLTGPLYPPRNCCGIHRNERTCEQALFLVLLLSILPNLVKLRLPVHLDSFRLPQIPNDNQSARYPILVQANSNRENHAALYQRHFPPLAQLQELDLVFHSKQTRDVTDFILDNSAVLHPDTFSWIAQRAPRLHTLRLVCFKRLNRLATSWPCDTITTLSLTRCDIQLPDLRRLVAACPRLRHFKMSSSPRRPYWPSRVNEDDTGLLRVDRNNASLVLATLGTLAPGLEKVFLGRCAKNRRPSIENGPEPDITPVLPTSGLNSLKTLGLTHANLFRNGDDSGNRHVLVNIITGCPTLETLVIFQPPGVWIGAAWTLLFRALEALGEDICKTRPFRLSHLREIKIWYDNDYDFLRDEELVEYLVDLFKGLGIKVRHEVQLESETTPDSWLLRRDMNCGRFPPLPHVNIDEMVE